MRSPLQRARQRLRKAIRYLGPGLITGASDNDPSGISTYSVAGASLGYALLWMSVFTLPLSMAVQDMCAKVGLVTKKGLATVIKEHYGTGFHFLTATIVIISNVATIGADLAGMAAGINLLIPSFFLSPSLLIPVIALSLATAEIYLSYRTIERYLKWTLILLFAYIAAGFLSHPDWGPVLHSTLIPVIRTDKLFITTIVAILGTTITPYLFFWQASQEVEEITWLHEKRISSAEYRGRMLEVDIGFIFTNIIFFFIILTSAATLNKAGITNIQTAGQAAQALKPVAGNLSFALFAMGLIAAGTLAIPVLAGSTAYVVAELMGWQEGLDKPFRKAPGYYGIIMASIFIGIGIDLVRFSAIKSMFYSQVLNGLLAPVLLVMILNICNDKGIMREHVNGRWMNLFGFLALASMTAAAIIFIILQAIG